MSIYDLINFYPSRKELCLVMGCSPQFLSQVVVGRRKLPVVTAIRIERLTDGRFKASDLRPDLFDANPVTTPVTVEMPAIDDQRPSDAGDRSSEEARA